MTSAMDVRGYAIVEGDTVIYPTRRGSMITMNEGFVEEIIDSTTVKVRRQREAHNFTIDGFNFLQQERLVTVRTGLMVRV